MKTIFNPQTLIFINVMLSAIGAWWAAIQNAGFEQDLRIKSEEISKLNKIIANTITGGNSFCRVSIMNIDPKTNQALLYFRNEGDFPLYDVTARIVDAESTNILSGNLAEENIEEIRKKIKNEIRMKVGDLAKNMAITYTEPLPLGNAEQKRFNIFFSARNGFFTQELRLKKQDGEWVQASKVTREDSDGEKQTIFEKIQDKYPKNMTDGIDW